jgi:hypothetical protein
VGACDVPRRQCFFHHCLGHLRSPRLQKDPAGKALDSARDFCPAHNDRERSLSVSVGERARIIWHCHAGCDPLAVRAALIRGGIPAGCLPIPKADEDNVVDQITALYAKGLSPPELRWRTYSVVQGFHGEMPPRRGYPGGRRGFARDAGVSPADLYGLRGPAR